MRIISKYIGKVFSKWFLWISLALGGIILLFDFAELLRRSSSKIALTPLKVWEMSLIKLPSLYLQVLPFIVLISAMVVLWFFNRSQELTIFRAVGLSVWGITRAMMGAVTLLGAFEITILNPLAATLMLKYQHMEDRYFKGNLGSLAVSGMGLWLREVHNDIQSVYRIGHLDSAHRKVRSITVFRTTIQDQFIDRYDAALGFFHGGRLWLKDVHVSTPHQFPVFKKEIDIPSATSFHALQNSGADPNSVSFWNLLSYSRLLEKSGLSPHKYLLQWHHCLAKWIWLGVMVLLAATCCLNPIRQGKTTRLIFTGLVTAFFLYVLKDISITMGNSLKISAAFAAWAPVMLSGLGALTVLLYSEDG